MTLLRHRFFIELCLRSKHNEWGGSRAGRWELGRRQWERSSSVFALVVLPSSHICLPDLPNSASANAVTALAASCQSHCNSIGQDFISLCELTLCHHTWEELLRNQHIALEICSPRAGGPLVWYLVRAMDVKNAYIGRVRWGVGSRDRPHAHLHVQEAGVTERSWELNLGTLIGELELLNGIVTASPSACCCSTGWCWVWSFQSLQVYVGVYVCMYVFFGLNSCQSRQLSKLSLLWSPNSGFLLVF